MLVIRFLRTGKRNQPSFKIVVTEKTKSSTSGRFVEKVGFYNPQTKEKILKQDRIKYWLSVGAKPLETVHNLLVSEKIIEGKKIDLHKKPKEKKESAPVEGGVTSTPEAKSAAKKVEPSVTEKEVKAEEKPTEPFEKKPQPEPKTEEKKEEPARKETSKAE